MEKKGNFTQGPVFGPLLRFALPVLLAIFLQTMYGAVDLLVVGQFGVAADVSAVSTGSQVMHTITIVINGLAMGVTVQLGRKIGEGKPEEAGQIAGSGIFLFTVAALIVTGGMLLAGPMTARLLRAPAEAFDRTVAYIRICASGALFIVAYNLLGSMFRGLGDSVMPLLSVSIACVANILGDLLLVAVFHLGTVGAAWATVLAQGISVGLSLAIIRRRKLPFTLTGRDIRPQNGNIRRILRLGVPVAVQDLLVSISILAIQAIVNSLGVMASAGVGVAEKLCGFVMLVPSAFSQAITAFSAQNFGAGKPERARRALRCGILASVIVGLLMAWLNFFHGDLMAGLFARDPQVIAAGAEYLKAYAIDCLLTAFFFCYVGYFNGRGNTMFVMVQGIVGAFGVRLPVSYIMSRVQPVSLFRIGLATPASSLVQLLLCVGFMLITTKQRKPVKN